MKKKKEKFCLLFGHDPEQGLIIIVILLWDIFFFANNANARKGFMLLK